MLETRPANSGKADVAVEQAIARTTEIIAARRWWFIATAILVFAGSIVVTKHQKPVYRATGMVQIDSAPPKILNDVSDVVTLGTSNFFAAKPYYSAQMQIIQSRDLAAIVVNSLKLSTNQHFLGIDAIDPPPSKEVRDKIIASADPVGTLAGRIGTELPDDSMIAKIFMEDTDPQFAQQVVNTVMQAYKDRNIDRKRSTVREASRELQILRNRLEEKKNLSQTQLFDFEKEHDFSDARRSALNERMLALNHDWREVHAIYLRATQDVGQLKKVRGTKDIFSAGAPTVMRDTLVGELKRRYMDLEIRRRELEPVYLDKHPKVEAITRQMDQLVLMATKHINALYDSATQIATASQAQLADLEAQIGKNHEEDGEIRRAKLEHDLLLAKADEDKMFYEKVGKRYAETDLARDVGVNNVSILDMATVPKTPVRPNLQLNMVIGLLLGLLCGLLAALVAEGLDNTIKDRADVEDRVGTTFLGSIPTFSPQDLQEGGPIPEGKFDLYVHFRPNSRVAEAARAVRTNLLFMRPDKPFRSLLVTSGMPREGKTSTSTTLAITLAASTGKAILVDTDLRKPRLHKVFDLTNEVGVTSYVVGHESVDKLVRPTCVTGLDFLACGPVPPNPSELLHTERFRQLVRDLQDRYDMVIFDSSPVDIVADALVLANMVDGVVLVGHAKRSVRQSVKAAVDTMRSINAPLLGMVLSRTSIHGAGYGYYYGQGYRRRAAYRYRYAIDPEQERKEEEERKRKQRPAA